MVSDSSEVPGDTSSAELPGAALNARIEALALFLADQASRAAPDAQVAQLNDRGLLDYYREACAERDRRVARLMGVEEDDATEPP